MPWELQAIPTSGCTSLGSVEQVHASLRAVFPTIEFYRDASGTEKIAEMGSRGIAVPDVIRENWLRSAGALQGIVQGDTFTIEFHFGDDEANVASIGIHVRSSDEPTRVIQRLKDIPGWRIVDPYDGSQADPTV